MCLSFFRVNIYNIVIHLRLRAQPREMCGAIKWIWISNPMSYPLSYPAKTQADYKLTVPKGHPQGILLLLSVCNNST